MEKHVYFVRHGETNSNADGIMRGAKSVLSEKGKQEAEMVADRVAQLNVEALLSSTYPRALDTAAPISERTGLPIIESDLFVERRRPSFEIGLSGRDPAVKEKWQEIMRGYANNPAYRHSDEENYADLRNRCEAALAYLLEQPASHVCVVSHGRFMRILCGLVLLREEFSSKAFVKVFDNFVIDNTGITHLRYTDNRGWQLVSWNDAAHLG